MDGLQRLASEDTHRRCICALDSLPFLLTTKELADFIRVPVKTIYDWNYRGVGPKSKRIGKRRLYERRDVCEWYEQWPDGFSPFCGPNG
jgi:Helix-turn-helix domain